ncbi:5-demethoxyubiquinone hydroxylase, mitochondrial-like [Amphibalanus amphitrite]|uniref:5-demethoxyubiquinone hydroxylase, mitochondrial-like n=1 Tax=Amphibalanus amphitrite TaxID=1232801 RepID=UPI001C90B59F|nr:5-demethoxyubiquinone hydroxylase, mitochondrial-like [Amphibalanus amphitrite]XP_043219013.1 5-demethoxyubiquinone hydroxylase, mitochondrial-like [Amphibalanus amphitrite]XP_043219014.1 5-demethoxyubiquinone hydroxylase, mitochondrial-like [Amphibalanus amphitrite]XP_043219015.1 5-demethoxyubiquinone hydroxylase, mitochondrial-like [Amphibalanus amphitrite]XP_043219016.1 5-demethoxyubiquinone hydroxylase, mitochondrial-like [Amphibalanus amphitrite]XP_043219018.1 5-demethoxyubiquinone hyd
MNYQTKFAKSQVFSVYRFYSSLGSRPSKQVDRILRVDHAGELGADRIYAGQMAVLGKTSVGQTIQHMWDQEKEHKAKFEELIPKYRARPTVMLPLWNVAGYVLGAGTALLGKEAAMACTVAVESVITDHYNSQIRELSRLSQETGEDHKELLEVISKFRDDEMEHHDTGLAHDAELAPAYQLLSQTIKAGCHAAIWVSERV